MINDTTQEALKLVLEFIENSECGTADLEALIKEALAQTQKPVAWLEPEWGEKICPEVGYEVTMTDDHPRDLCWIPLYAHPAKNKTENIGCLGMPVNVPVTPPQRTWVGLTRDEQSFVYSSLHSATSRKDSFWVDFANAIEDRLKEKNT